MLGPQRSALLFRLMPINVMGLLWWCLFAWCQLVRPSVHRYVRALEIRHCDSCPVVGAQLDTVFLCLNSQNIRLNYTVDGCHMPEFSNSARCISVTGYDSNVCWPWCSFIFSWFVIFVEFGLNYYYWEKTQGPFLIVVYWHSFQLGPITLILACYYLTFAPFYHCTISCVFICLSTNVRIWLYFVNINPGWFIWSMYHIKCLLCEKATAIANVMTFTWKHGLNVLQLDCRFERDHFSCRAWPNSSTPRITICQKARLDCTW